MPERIPDYEFFGKAEDRERAIRERLAKVQAELAKAQEALRRIANHWTGLSVHARQMRDVALAALPDEEERPAVYLDETHRHTEEELRRIAEWRRSDATAGRDEFGGRP
jgi:hypothetical protein